MLAGPKLVALSSERPPAALRPPPGSPRFAALDGIRGLAALAILFFHAGIVSGYNQVGRFGQLTGHRDVAVPASSCCAPSSSGVQTVLSASAHLASTGGVRHKMLIDCSFTIVAALALGALSYGCVERFALRFKG
jgi:peptidoglycan/LPS O-acetylase OafA/YrhL